MTGRPDFREVFRFLAKSRIRYVIVGGFAAGILGEPRATVDIDLITFMPTSDLEKFILYAGKHRVKFSAGEIRKSIQSNAFFRIKISGTQVDFIVGESAFEFEVLTRGITTRIFGYKIPVASPEDMILMKLVSGRLIDWNDAKAIQLRYFGKMDVKYIESWANRLKVQRGQGHVISRWRKLLVMKLRG